MMRSMYSAVSGLKTHQTRMDVIGNNIANVNTVAFKSSTVTFSDILYQTTSGASGANAATGIGGINAKQIGLGVSTASTSVSIETAGAAETTGNPFDIRLTDANSTNFFIVNDGTQNLFTRAGSFYVDGAGNLCMTSTGYTVMGWQYDEGTKNIRKDTVSPLRILQESNMTSPPEATTQAVCGGVIDKNDSDATSKDGKTMNLNFFDNLGYSYTAKFSIKTTDVEGEYTVALTDIIDSNGDSIVDTLNAHSLEDIVSFGEQKNQTITYLAQLGEGVSYDATSKKFTKELAGLENVASDYENKKANGFEYSDLTLNGTSIDTKATADFSVKDLTAEPYNLVYVTEDSDGNALTTPYYYLKDDVTGTGKKLDPANTNDWVDALGIDTTSGLKITSITIDTSGNVSIEGTQSFTATDGIESKNGDNKAPFILEGITAEEAYGVDTTDGNTTYYFDVAPDGQAQITKTTVIKGNTLKFNVDDGTFISINGSDTALLNFNDNYVDKNGDTLSLNKFFDTTIDFTQCLNYNNGGKSTIGMDSGALDGTTGKGRKLGTMTGVSIDNSGKIWGSYDNGNTELLGQIAVAQFANASGLEKIGDSCYQTTLNSGEFDGIGVEITADGSSMTTGELEMSNVDLSQEFTQMITTQRGFQANSRVITTSDTLLEELVNLKR